MLTESSSFVDYDMLMRYYGGGIGRGDSTGVSEVKVGPAEVMHESPDAHFKFKDMDEGSDDDEADDPAPGDSMRKRKWQVHFKCILQIAVYPRCSTCVENPYGGFCMNQRSLYHLARAPPPTKRFVGLSASSHSHTNSRQPYYDRWEILTGL